MTGTILVEPVVAFEYKVIASDWENAVFCIKLFLRIIKKKMSSTDKQCDAGGGSWWWMI